MSQKPKLGGKFEEDVSSVVEDISDKLGEVVNKVPHVVVFNSKGIRRESEESEEYEELSEELSEEEEEDLSEEGNEETIAEVPEEARDEVNEETHEDVHEETHEDVHEETHEEAREETHANEETVGEYEEIREEMNDDELDIKIIETLNLDSFTLDKLQAMTVTKLRCILKDQGVSIPKSIRKNALVQKVYELRNN